MMSADDVPTPVQGAFAPDEIVLYGVKINDGSTGKIPFLDNELVIEVKAAGGGAASGYTMAVVYGYAYEGGCYRLDMPKLLIFKGGEGADADGCGFAAPYKMWRISPRDDVLKLGAVVDTAKEAILEANKPQNRGPNTYGNHMQLAHRGGRLTSS